MLEMIRPFAAIVLWLFAFSAVAQSQKPTPSGVESQAQHESAAANKHADSQPTQRGTIDAPFVIQIKPQNQDDITAKTEKDGRWYAAPDWWVAGFTGALFLATAGLWVFTALLWKSTKRLVADTKDSSSKQLRAYIGHRDVKFLSGNLKYFAENFGASPAHNVSMHIRVSAAVPDTLDDDLCIKIPVVQMVSPGQNLGKIIDKDWDSGASLFLYGYVDYDDIFEKKWRYRFAFSYDPYRPSMGDDPWVAHSSHNDEQKRN